MQLSEDAVGAGEPPVLDARRSLPRAAARRLPSARMIDRLHFDWLLIRHSQATPSARRCPYGMPAVLRSPPVSTRNAPGDLIGQEAKGLVSRGRISMSGKRGTSIAVILDADHGLKAGGATASPASRASGLYRFTINGRHRPNALWS